jgi:hypothetical protein
MTRIDREECLLSIEKREGHSFSSFHREGIFLLSIEETLYIEEIHSLLFTEKESASSLYGGVTFSPRYE